MRNEHVAGLPTPDPGVSTDGAGSEIGTCPFLRAINDDDSLGPPIDSPDQANRCIAIGDAVPQSLRQQDLACLSSAHVNCPRFVRGALDIIESPVPVKRPGTTLTPAVIGALLVLAASFALSVGFVVANGGMDLPVAPSAGPQTAVESAAPSVDARPDGSAVPASVSPLGSAPAPAATPAASPAGTAAPSTAPTARPTSDRYALLDPCLDAPDCWIYVVRGGDNLVSIANYFGVPLAVVTELNPWTTTTQLVAGQELRLPAPTR